MTATTTTTTTEKKEPVEDGVTTAPDEDLFRGDVDLLPLSLVTVFFAERHDR